MMQTKKERTKNEIIEAAKKIIYTGGYESFTVRALAKSTGFSYTNVYYYFKDLHTLLWELRLDMIEDMITELTSISIHTEDPIDEIVESLQTYISYFFQYPNVFRFFYFYKHVQPEGDKSYEKLEHKFNSMWQTSFFRLIQEQIIHPEEIEVVAKTIVYALQGMIMLSFSSNGSIIQKDIETEMKKTVYHILKK